jgi:hypothetical protein
VTVHDAKLMVRNRFSGRTEEPGRENRRSDVKRGLGDSDEQLQRHRAFGVVLAEPLTIRDDTVMGGVRRRVPSDMRVNPLGVMVIGP